MTVPHPAHVLDIGEAMTVELDATVEPSIAFVFGSDLDSPYATVTDVLGATAALCPALSVGGRELVVIAGPCSVEGRAMLVDTARAVGSAGARMLRGGAYKPRTSPHTFQGLGDEALEYLAEARAALAAQAKLSTGDDGNDSFYQAKISTARFYADHVLSQAPALRHTVVSGAAGVLALDEEQF